MNYYVFLILLQVVKWRHHEAHQGVNCAETHILAPLARRTFKGRLGAITAPIRGAIMLKPTFWHR